MNVTWFGLGMLTTVILLVTFSRPLARWINRLSDYLERRFGQ